MSVNSTPVTTTTAGTTAWNTTTNLPQALNSPTSVTYNGYIYELGGQETSGTIISTVEYAPLNSNGSVGAWTSTTALPQALWRATSVVYNGYIYEIGGDDAGIYQSTVYYAPLNSNGSVGTWTSTTALPQALGIATSVVYNGYVYEIGGYNGTAIQSTVYYAPLNSNGSVGTWTSTTALPQITFVATSVVYNDYVYEIGGSNGSVNYSSVYYAPLNSNGSVGTWTSTTALPQALPSAASVIHNGYIYIMGGYQNTVYYAPINLDGSIGNWALANAVLPQIINSAAGVTYNGYVYLLGGYNNGQQSTVYYAQFLSNTTAIEQGSLTLNAGTIITGPTLLQNTVNSTNAFQVQNSTGSTLLNVDTVNNNLTLNTGTGLSNWSATTNLPQVLDDATSVTYNGYIYELGGNNSGTYQSTVYYAPLNSNGSVGTWTSTTALPQTLYQATSVVYNGYIYELGGNNSGTQGTVQSTVYYAPLNSNGSVGTWTSTTALPQGLEDSTSVVYNGYIYELGGYTTTGPPLSITYYAPLNSNGSVGTWTSTTALPQALDGATSVVYNGYAYVIGGDNGLGGQYSTVYYAPLNSNGSVGTWTSTTGIPQTLQQPTSVVYNGYIYELGGNNSGTYQSTVYYSSLTPGNSTVQGNLQVEGASTLNGSTVINGASSSGSVLQVNNVAGNSLLSLQNSTVDMPSPALQPWTTNSTVVPQVLDSATSVKYNGYIYEIGGVNSAYQSTVYYAPLNSNGSVGTWTSTTALPQTLASATSVIYNGYIYEIGGDDAGTYQSTVYYAPLNPNGSVGTWTSTTALPQALWQATSVVYNGYIYELGGGNSSSDQSTVYYAPLNSNGSVGTWTSTTALPQASAAATSVTYNGYVYVIGGNNGSTYASTVYYAPLNSNGSVGTWTSTTALPQVLQSATSVIYNGYIYELSGYNGTYQSTIYYTSLTPVISPSSTLSVNGGIVTTGNGTLRLQANGTLSGYGGVEFANVADYGLQVASYQYEFNAANGTTNYLTINGSGNVGIGTSSPTTALDVQGSNATGYIQTLFNTSTATSAGTPASSSDGLLIELGTLDANRTTGNTFIGFADSTGALAGAIVGGASAVAYNTTGADYAEYFLASNPTNLPQPGQLVSIASTNNSVTQSNNTIPIGIVSTNPGFVGNGPICKISNTNCQTNYNKDNVIVALAGQVPTKVSVTNGPINVGDPITSSSIPGVGEKATSAGYIIGYALTPTTTNGTIQVLIRPSYYNPSNSQTLQANNIIANMLTVNSAINASSINDSNLLTTKTLNVIGSATIGGDLTINGGLTVEGMTTVSDITINGHIITSGKTPTVSILPSAGTNATVTITGNDTSGTITITTGSTITTTNSNGQTVVSGNNPGVGGLVTVEFSKSYLIVPASFLNPINSRTADLSGYSSNQTTSGFNISVNQVPKPNTTYTFEYFVIQ